MKSPNGPLTAAIVLPLISTAVTDFWLNTMPRGYPVRRLRRRPAHRRPFAEVGEVDEVMLEIIHILEVAPVISQHGRGKRVDVKLVQGPVCCAGILYFGLRLVTWGGLLGRSKS